MLGLTLLMACGRTDLVPTPAMFVLDAGTSDAGPRDDAGRRDDAGLRDAGIDTSPIDAGRDAGFDGGQVDPGPWSPKRCIPGRSALIRPVPVVVLVVDGSGSMAEPFTDAPTKADAVRGALQNVLPSWDPWMELGSIAFPSGNECDVITAGYVPPARGQLEKVLRYLGGSSGDSPTAETLSYAGQQLALRRASNTARQLVLVTDGFPTCNNRLDPTRCRCEKRNCLPKDCLDHVRTGARIADVASQGIPTWVIGLDTADAGLGPVLNAFAEVGGHARTMADGRRYLRAGSGQAFGEHLTEVRDRMLRCSFITPSVPARDDGIDVLVGGAPVSRDAVNGWSWVDRENGELALRGLACASQLVNRARVGEAVVRCP
ncbi:MAG: vWA domain-containing protein [Myxococcales bacterium]|nr:vWA domain-containing protein [Myxococcales bacterium]